ncbi:MAG TPA: PilN domain-containing protein [Pseudidiomarina sp.]|nr:PilN domain-containing protein [Pseudidiomarina sp.]
MKSIANLYVSELKPRYERYTLPIAAAICGGLAVALLVANVIGNQWLASEQATAQALQTEITNQQKLLDVQQELLKQRTNDPVLVARQEQLEKQIAQRQRLQRQMQLVLAANDDQVPELLADIAKVDAEAIWLQRITLRDGELTLHGFTQQPAQLPLWIERFARHPSLKDRQFGVFDLRVANESALEFTVGTLPAASSTAQTADSQDPQVLPQVAAGGQP